MTKQEILEQIQGGLIVSCQALEHEPLYTKEGGIMPLMAKAAAQSGAVGIRANTVRDITQIKEVVELPVIGIIKREYEGTPMYITVTMREVDELVACGVDIIAVQGTGALRPDGSSAPEFIRAIRAKYPDQLMMADCATLEEGIACAKAGADFVGTPCGDTHRRRRDTMRLIMTLSGSFRNNVRPELSQKDIFIIRNRRKKPGSRCLCAGSGGAITRPAEITARFVSAIGES